MILKVHRASCGEKKWADCRGPRLAARRLQRMGPGGSGAAHIQGGFLGCLLGTGKSFSSPSGPRSHAGPHSTAALLEVRN